MARRADIFVSFTETRQFQRLVEFLREIDDLARVNADEELRELVERCLADLLAMKGTNLWPKP